MKFGDLSYDVRDKLMWLGKEDVEVDFDESTETLVCKYGVDGLVFSTVFNFQCLVDTKVINNGKGTMSRFDFTPPVVLKIIKERFGL